jgi:hypothetical protein
VTKTNPFSNLDRARAELVGRGVEVSEIVRIGLEDGAALVCFGGRQRLGGAGDPGESAPGPRSVSAA